MTQPETSGVLKLVKDMVFSDLMKLAKNACNNQNSFDENKNSFQNINGTSGYSKLTSIRPQFLKNGNICFADDAEVEEDKNEDSNSSIREDYSCCDEEDQDNEIIYIEDIRFKLIDDKAVESESKKVSEIISEFRKLSPYTLTSKNSIKKQESKQNDGVQERSGTIISVSTLNEYK